MAVKMPLSICHCLATHPQEGKELLQLLNSQGILIEMLPGAATGQQAVIGIMAVKIEMTCQRLVFSE